MTIEIIFSAFFAGLLTFFAPCTLPLIPGYLAYISGMSSGELRSGSRIQKKVFFHSLAFVFGFTLIFVAFGILAGFLGSLLADIQEWLTRIGGVVVIVFGLFLLGIFDVSFFQKTIRFDVSKKIEKGKFLSSFLFGISFGVGWTPCIGPILGAILVIASSRATTVEGGILLLIFSAGLSMPFLFVSLVSGFALEYIQKFNAYLRYVSVIGGIFLILLGVLMIFDNFSMIVSWGFLLLDFLHYEQLLNYL